jgi:hypothetical protein
MCKVNRVPRKGIMDIKRKTIFLGTNVLPPVIPKYPAILDQLSLG